MLRGQGLSERGWHRGRPFRGKHRNLSTGKQAANVAHAKIRAVSEQVMVTLKGWRLLREPGEIALRPGRYQLRLLCRGRDHVEALVALDAFPPQGPHEDSLEVWVAQMWPDD